MPGDGPRFRLLGPVEVRVGVDAVDIGPAKQRCVLAVLVLATEPQLAAGTLVDRVWGDQPPDEARNALYSYLTRLRRVLRGSGVEIRRRSGGYVIDVGRGSVDVRELGELVNEAKAEPPRRAELLGRALDLWHGEPLSGLAGDWAERTRVSLRRQRLGLLTEWAAVCRAEGDAAGVVTRLRPALQTYPLAEALAAQLVRALHEAGQTAEALDCYETTVRRLSEDLGAEPGPMLLEAYQDVRARPGAVPVPAQLPAAPAGFVGREAQLARLDTMPGLVVITGQAGVGKTALALTWGHRIADRFPDGRLYADLRGYAKGEPLRAVDVLSAFLRALGVSPEQIPLDEESAAAWYRTLLAGRKLLVLLDNAASAEQVRPLLPGTPGSVAVVTSRDGLSGLLVEEGARRLRLDSLPHADALEVLSRGLGAGRVSGAPEAADDLVTLCGRLPLALRIAVANLLDDPGCDIGDYVAELRAETPLAALETADAEAAVRTAFELSYLRLDAEQRRLFRLLSVHPGPDFPAEVAAAVAGIGQGAARRLLDRLTSAHMLEPRGRGRAAFHDLLRQFAAERLAADDPPEARAAAFDRLAEFSLRTASAAASVGAPVLAPLARVSAPGFADDVEAIAWLDAERANLLALAEAGPSRGRPELAWQLCDVLRGYLQIRSHHHDWRGLAEHALRVASGDRAVAAALLSQGYLQRLRLDDDEAVGTFARAATHAERAGWVAGQAVVLIQLGWVLPRLGRPDEAAEGLRRAIVLAAGAGEPAIESTAHGNLGALHERLGRLLPALPHLRAELRHLRLEPAKYREANGRTDLGNVLAQLGELGAAVTQQQAALRLARELGNRRLEAFVRANLASAFLDVGEFGAASAWAASALELADRLALSDVEAEACSALGVVASREGSRASELFQRALAAGERAGDVRSRLLAEVRFAEELGSAEDASRLVALAREQRLRVLEARALLALARSSGDVEAALASRALCGSCAYAPGLHRAEALIRRSPQFG